jgi:hypothetical protein
VKDFFKKFLTSFIESLPRERGRKQVGDAF